MKTAVLSYSLTGNNQTLAQSIANKINAEHIKITEPKRRTNGTIAFDMLFNRIPKVQPLPDKLASYDMVYILGPIWMGKIATPIRAYLRYIKIKPQKYAFISISGGADGANPKIAGELLKTTGTEPVIVIDKHIADLLPSDPKPTRKITSAYRLTEKDVENLTISIVESLNQAIEK